MKKRIMAAVLAMVMLATGAFMVSANEEYNGYPNGYPGGYEAAPAFTFTGVFNIMDGMENNYVDFSMISADGELVIHINDDVPVYFEGYVPKSDDEDAEMTRDARLVLFGRTLEEVLEGRNLRITYDISTRSIPPQTTPLMVEILFEAPVHLPIEIDPGNMYYDFGGIGEEVFFFDLALPFEDISYADWFWNAAVWAYGNGFMMGIGEAEFAPYAPMTRGMLVTILHRYAGLPAGQGAFADVAEDAWYADAVAWAAYSGIVEGVGEGNFAPNALINREQLYTILYRFMEHKGLNLPVEDEMRLNQFADADLVSPWAAQALHLMFDAGIMFRESSFDTYARPQDAALRSEVAAALFFFNMYAH